MSNKNNYLRILDIMADEFRKEAAPVYKTVVDHATGDSKRVRVVSKKYVPNHEQANR